MLLTCHIVFLARLCYDLYNSKLNCLVGLQAFVDSWANDIFPCFQAGLMDLAKKFGLSPEQFADNLKDNYQKHEVEQYPVEPVELAQEHVGA